MAHASVTLGGSNPRSNKSNPPAVSRRRGPRRTCAPGFLYGAPNGARLGALESQLDGASGGGRGWAWGGRSRRRRARLRLPEFGQVRAGAARHGGNERRGSTASWRHQEHGDALGCKLRWPGRRRRHERRRESFGRGGERSYGAGTRGRREGNGGGAHRGPPELLVVAGDALETANRSRRSARPRRKTMVTAAPQGVRRLVA